jgi:hypothetical protein
LDLLRLIARVQGFVVRALPADIRSSTGLEPIDFDAEWRRLDSSTVRLPQRGRRTSLTVLPTP